MQRVATLTLNPAVDVNTKLDHMRPDKKLRCEPPIREPGGGGVNVSRAIQRLGGRSDLFYMAGGSTGDILQQLLKDERLDEHRIETQEWTRENVNVQETRSHQQFRLVMPGPRTRADEWGRALEQVFDLDPPPAYMVASGSVPQGVPDDFHARLARHSEERHVRLIVDTSGPALKSLTGAGAFLVKPNLSELHDLVGRTLEGEEEQIAAAREMIKAGTSSVIVLSLGKGGAVLVTEEQDECFRTPTVPIRSKVGAGDSMVAGIVLGLARSLDLREAVRFGVAAGAAAVMTEGTELCRREDAERLYTQMKNRV